MSKSTSASPTLYEKGADSVGADEMLKFGGFRRIIAAGGEDTIRSKIWALVAPDPTMTNEAVKIAQRAGA